jgi:DNA polymerase elongation subunit (family B)
MTKEERIKKIEELREKASQLKRDVDYYNALQLALKLVLNGSYGAFAANYFVLFNNYVAGTITAQGRDLTQTMDRVNQSYWYDIWHLDTETHEKMGITNVRKIQQTEPVSIYADTDSVDGKTLIRTSSGTKTIEDWYNSNIENPNGVTLCGHESVKTLDKVLNWDENKGLYFADVNRIIRHKVSKPKWKLKTKSGREVIVTNDHSMIVFRNGEKLEIKPDSILPTDKILTIYEE